MNALFWLEDHLIAPFWALGTLIGLVIDMTAPDPAPRPMPLSEALAVIAAWGGCSAYGLLLDAYIHREKVLEMIAPAIAHEEVW